MAGNNSIQILRGSAANIANSDESLLDGQLLYNEDTNQLIVGSSSCSSMTKSAIVSSAIAGYVVGTATESYSIKNNMSTLEYRAPSLSHAFYTQYNGTGLQIFGNGTATALYPLNTNLLQIGKSGQTLYINATNGVYVNSSLSICSATKNAYMLYNEVADSFFVSSAGSIEMHTMGGMAGTTTLMMASNSVSFMVNSKTVNVSNQAGTMPVVFNGSTAVNKLQFTLSGTTLTITTT